MLSRYSAAKAQDFMLTNLYAFRTVTAFFAVGFFLVTVGAFRVSADVATISINTPNFSGVTGPYATVTIDRTSSTTATVTFQSSTNGGNLYLMGGQGAVDLNVNGTYQVALTSSTVLESNS